MLSAHNYMISDDTYDNEVPELEVASKTGGFTGDTLHQTTVSTEHYTRMSRYSMGRVHGLP